MEYNREWSFSKAKLAKNTELFREILKVSWAFKQGEICTLKSCVIDSPADKSQKRLGPDSMHREAEEKAE
jgi:hypothetical protein